MGLTVRDVIDRVHEWLKEDIVDREVWNSVHDLIDFDPPALPPRPYAVSAECAKKRKQVSSESKSDFRHFVGGTRMFFFGVMSRLSISKLS